MPRKKKRQKRTGGNLKIRHRVPVGTRDLGEMANLRICALARFGFYVNTIVSVMDTYDGIYTSESTVRYVLKKAGVTTSAYRRGEGQDAIRVINGIMKNSAIRVA